MDPTHVPSAYVHPAEIEAETQNQVREARAPHVAVAGVTDVQYCFFQITPKSLSQRLRC